MCNVYSGVYSLYNVVVRCIALPHNNSRVPSSILKSGYCLCGVMYILPVSTCFLRVAWFPPTLQKHASRYIGYAKLNKGVNVCVSCPKLASYQRIPTHAECSWDTLTTMKRLLKMNEWMNVYSHLQSIVYTVVKCIYYIFASISIP